jgi:hypothetical protein
MFPGMVLDNSGLCPSGQGKGKNPYFTRRYFHFAPGEGKVVPVLN